MTRFKVIHVDGERGLRGGERQLLYLACALRARGHENLVVCRDGSPLQKEAERLGLATETLPFLGELDPFSALKLARLAKGGRIVHAHTAHAAGVAAAARALGAPAAVVHRRVDFRLAGGLSRAFKYERAARVVAVSEAIAGVLAKDGLDARRVSVVPDAVPADAEERRWAGEPDARLAPASPEERLRCRRALSLEFGLPEGTAWVGNLAALVPHKDHDNLLAAAILVGMKRPDVTFVIAGGGPEHERLLGAIKRSNLLGKVFLIGHRPDAAAVLKALDVFALSSWGEGMGSVLLEAAACALPIAATTAGGIPEVVEDGVTGLLCPPRDGEALAGRLLELLGDPASARAMGERARAALPRFGLKRMAERMEEIYAAL